MRQETPVEYIRYKIKEYGFLSATRVTFLLKDYNSELNDDKIKQILDDIVGDGIHRVEYTNRYVAPYTTKGLYLYNPNRYIKKRPTKKKKVTKKKADS